MLVKVAQNEILFRSKIMAIPIRHDALIHDFDHVSLLALFATFVFQSPKTPGHRPTSFCSSTSEAGPIEMSETTAEKVSRRRVLRDTARHTREALAEDFRLQVRSSLL